MVIFLMAIHVIMIIIITINNNSNNTNDIFVYRLLLQLLSIK